MTVQEMREAYGGENFDLYSFLVDKVKAQEVFPNFGDARSSVKILLLGAAYGMSKLDILRQIQFHTKGTLEQGSQLFERLSHEYEQLAV